MFNPKPTFKTLLLLVLAPLCFTPIAAQSTTATLSGTVTDEREAVVPGAEVTITNTENGFNRTIQTGDGGTFVFPLLPPAAYRLTVKRTGFSPYEVTSIILNVNDQKSLLIQLKVGQVTDQVIVTAEAPLIDDSSAVSTTVDRQFVANLPLNGRSFNSLIALTPGVVQTKTNAGPGQFSVNGQRSNANYFTVDGVSANAGVTPTASLVQTPGGSTPALSALGGTNNLVSVDALQEFKIQTSSYAAEFGRTPGGQVQISTRSGTNDFHGTLFNYFRNDKLDANDWFANANRVSRVALRQNDFGGTISGPIYFFPRFGEGGPGWYNGKNKTFFFFSYEGLRLLQPRFVANAEVPSISLRNSAPASIRPYLNAFAVPNGADLGNGLQLFSGGFSNPSNLDATSIRIDHNFSDKVSLFGRYNNSPSKITFRENDFLTGPRTTVIDTETLTIGSAQIFSSKFNNDLRFNYSRNEGATFFEMDNFGGAVPIDGRLLLSPATAPERSSGTFLFNFGTGPGLQSGRNSLNVQKQFNLVDSLAFTVGSHQLKFGIDYRRLSPLFQPFESSLQALFSNAAAVNSAIASTVAVIAAQTARPVYTNFSAFAQDTWKATPRLTLTYGVRWEVNPPPGSADGRLPLTALGVDNPATMTVAPEGTPLYKTKYNNFAPRFGIAYQLFDKPGRETVLRGGIGVFYDLGNGTASLGYGNLPFRTGFKVTSNVPYPATGPAVQPLPFSLVFPLANFNAFDPNLRLPRTYQWNLAVEQSLGANQTVSASYVAAVGRDLFSADILINPNPTFARISIFENEGTSDYHSMQLEYQRRLTNGLQVLGSYTWAKSIDLVSNELTATAERGPSDFDVRHNFKAAATYELPYPKFNRFTNAILHDWSLDGIIRYQTATPVDLVARTSTIAGQSVSQRPDVTPGMPLYLDNPNAPGGRTFNNTIDPSRPGCKGPFCPPPPLVRQGTLGRNVLRGFPLSQFDLSLRRQFNFNERWRLQLRGDVFNILNHPNFADPNPTLTSGTFGRSNAMFGTGLATGSNGLNPLYQVGGARSIQLSFKLLF